MKKLKIKVILITQQFITIEIKNQDTFSSLFWGVLKLLNRHTLR